MAIINIPYVQAKSQHPAEVTEIVQHIRAGKSKTKDLPPEEMQWSYQIGEEIREENMNIASPMERAARRIALSFCYLTAKAGRTCAQARVGIPIEWANMVYDHEYRRIAELSPQERANEITEVINNLPKSVANNLPKSVVYLTTKRVRLVVARLACPEQYDVFVDGELVGMMQACEKYFTANYFPLEQIVFQCPIIGDGCLHSYEKNKILNEACRAILIVHDSKDVDLLFFIE